MAIVKNLQDVEDTIEAMDDDRLDHVEKLIEIIKNKRLEAKRFPIKTTLYFHRDKSDNFPIGSRFKLTDKQMENFIYAGYELEVNVEIDENGMVRATAINGVDLTDTVVI